MRDWGRGASQEGLGEGTSQEGLGEGTSLEGLGEGHVIGKIGGGARDRKDWGRGNFELTLSKVC